MKKVLSLLFAFVFCQVQSWALSGGPQYASLNNNVSGTWAGTMLGSLGANALGLFQIGMPQSGLGSGQFAFYAGGGAFLGTIVALADGEKDSMSAMMKGQLLEQVVVATATTFGTALEDVADMGGSWTAKITGDIGGSTTINVGARLSGTGSVSVTQSPLTTTVPAGITFGTATITIDGFLQSSAVTGQVSLNSITSTTPAGGG
jgi:hypothetical protein